MPTVADFTGETDPARTKWCDACEMYWEPEFFCEKCSGIVENPYHEPFGGDFDNPYFIHADICLNCCTCHLRKKTHA